MLGRDDEIDTLRHVLQMATARSRGQLVLLYGDAGVGKSRLANEVAHIAREELGARVLFGQCVPYGDANVFGPVAEALRSVCGIEGLAGSSEARLRVVETVSATLGFDIRDPADVTFDSEGAAGETERLVEGLMYVMEGTTRPGVDPTRAREEGIRAALAFLEALSARTPIVLGLADLHWADEPVLELADRLLVAAAQRAARAARHRAARLRPTLVTGVGAPQRARAPPRPARPRGHRAARARAVRGLRRRRDWSTPCWNAAVATRSSSRNWSRTSRTRERSGAAPTEGLRDLPATLHGLVAARLDALEPAERSLLEDCAVVGGGGPIGAAFALAGREDAPRLLERLAERDLVVVDGDEFHFKSELIREIAYGTLTKAERARRHAHLAPLLEARGDVAVGQVANHLATAAELVAELGPVPGVDDDIRERAVAALTRAARQAEEVESWVVSGHHHDRTLGLLPDDPCEQRWTALLGRGRTRLSTARARRRPGRRAHRARRVARSREHPLRGRRAHADRRAARRERRLQRRRSDAVGSGPEVARGGRRFGRRQRSARARNVAPLPRRAQRSRRADLRSAGRVSQRRQSAR